MDYFTNFTVLSHLSNPRKILKKSGSTGWTFISVALPVVSHLTKEGTTICFQTLVNTRISTDNKKLVSPI